VKHTISALVQNRVGVVAEATDVFRKYNVNIKSVSCGETEDFDVSRLVITVEGQSAEVERICAELSGLDFIREVEDLARKDFVDRELALLRVSITRDTMSQVMQIFEVFRANVVGMGQETITVELTGDQEKVDGFIKMLRPHGIRSLCRTGVIALRRGDED